MRRLTLAFAFMLVSCSRSSIKPMIFKVFWLPETELAEGLSLASEDGWELVSTRRDVTNGNANAQYEVICRRPAWMGDKSPHLNRKLSSIVDEQLAAEHSARQAVSDWEKMPAAVRAQRRDDEPVWSNGIVFYSFGCSHPADLVQMSRSTAESLHLRLAPECDSSFNSKVVPDAYHAPK